jgi:hypothetical protein
MNDYYLFFDLSEDMMNKRKIIGVMIVVMTLMLITAVMMACSNRPSAAELQRKIDSVRTLENMEQLRAQGINIEAYDPIADFYDSLHVQTLPLRGTVDYARLLPNFSEVPTMLASVFNIPSADGKLKAIALPETLSTRLLIIAADNGNGDNALWLCTFDMDNQLVDKLLLHNPTIEDYTGDKLHSFNITSSHLITLQEYNGDDGTLIQQSYEIDEGRQIVKQ